MISPKNEQLINQIQEKHGLRVYPALIGSLGTYKQVPWMFTALVSIGYLVLVVLYFILTNLKPSVEMILWVIGLQVLVMIGAFILASRNDKLKAKMVSETTKVSLLWDMVEKQFLDLKVYEEPNRMGVLLLISNLEPKVKIKVDTGVKSKVDYAVFENLEKTLQSEIVAIPSPDLRLSRCLEVINLNIPKDK